MKRKAVLTFAVWIRVAVALVLLAGLAVARTQAEALAPSGDTAPGLV